MNSGQEKLSDSILNSEIFFNHFQRLTGIQYVDILKISLETTPVGTGEGEGQSESRLKIMVTFFWQKNHHSVSRSLRPSICTRF